MIFKVCEFVELKAVVVAYLSEKFPFIQMIGAFTLQLYLVVSVYLANFSCQTNSRDLLRIYLKVAGFESC